MNRWEVKPPSPQQQPKEQEGKTPEPRAGEIPTATAEAPARVMVPVMVQADRAFRQESSI